VTGTGTGTGDIVKEEDAQAIMLEKQAVTGGTEKDSVEIEGTDQNQTGANKSQAKGKTKTVGLKRKQEFKEENRTESLGVESGLLAIRTTGVATPRQAVGLGLGLGGLGQSQSQGQSQVRVKG
jgi:hypothetical protein